VGLGQRGQTGSEDLGPGEYQRAVRKREITVPASRGVNLTRYVSYQSESQTAARKHQVNNNKSSRRKQRRGKLTRSKIATSRRLGLGHQESPNIDTVNSGSNSITRLRRSVSYFVATTPWHIGRRVGQTKCALTH